jgi:hypothetical protein
MEKHVVVAFRRLHGYRIEAVLNEYRLGRVETFEAHKIPPLRQKAELALKEA